MGKIKDVLLGIADSILPGFSGSIKKTNDGQMEVNKLRLISALLSYTLFIGILKGWVTLETAAQLIKIIIE